MSFVSFVSCRFVLIGLVSFVSLRCLAFRLFQLVSYVPVVTNCHVVSFRSCRLVVRSATFLSDSLRFVLIILVEFRVAPCCCTASRFVVFRCVSLRYVAFRLFCFEPTRQVSFHSVLFRFVLFSFVSCRVCSHC